MAKMTLLEMTQRILSAMDGDEVNSITDTTEAEQVATCIRQAYEDLVSSYRIDELMNLFTLTALGDTSSPTRMQVPSGVDKIEWIRYNKVKSGETQARWEEIPYVTRAEFATTVFARNSSASNVVSVVENGVTLYIHNDRGPQFYTSFDDDIILFDAYDSTVDNTLQSSKTSCFGKIIPSWTVSDSFTPDLDSNLFPLLLNEAKSLAFIELKQQANQKAEQEARRQRVKMQNDRSKFNNQLHRPDYGR